MKKTLSIVFILMFAFAALPSWSAQAKNAAPEKKIKIYVFWGKGCPHCAKELGYLNTLPKKYPQVEIKTFEVWKNKENAKIFTQVARAYGVKNLGVPFTIIGSSAIPGFRSTETTGKELEKKIEACVKKGCDDALELALRSSEGKTPIEKTVRPEDKTVSLPGLGEISIDKYSLPVLTLILAGMDSFNPCAFFVLFLLLSLLIHAKSRKRMFFIGGTFVFFSGLIYFVFMAAWLNFFMHAGEVRLITVIAGVMALVIGFINVKDFFAFKKGVSLTIPESAKPKLFERMRGLLKATSLPSLLVGTAVLAVTANTYELLCTVGFPMVFTRVLTLHKLSTLQYYLYLVYYNLVYVIPLAVIVVIFSVTLGAKKLTEGQGQALKLISGLMMLSLAFVLLINPDLLNNVVVSLALLASSLAGAGIVILAAKKFKIR